MYYVLIFDADNTLWDTNSVFHEAHVAMLEVFEEAELLSNAADHVERVREIDRCLMEHYGRFEYGFKNLVIAVAHHYRFSVSPLVAAARAIQGSNREIDATLLSTIDSAYQAHTDTLAQIPPLFASVADILVGLRTYRTRHAHVATLIFSEGHPDRLEKTFLSHDIGQHNFFDDIVVELKTPKAFQRVGDLGRGYLSVPKGCEVVTIVIGDSIQRDIRLANEAGYTTVYIPAGFEGRQTPQTVLDQPDFQLDKIAELPAVLASLGLHLSDL